MKSRSMQDRSNVRFDRYQLDFIEGSISRPGNHIARAVPGGGKTTVLFEVARRLLAQNVTVTYTTFSRRFADEAKERFGGRCRVNTTHSFGFEVCRKSIPGFERDGSKPYRIAESLVKSSPSVKAVLDVVAPMSLKLPFNKRISLLVKFVDIVKQCRPPDPKTLEDLLKQFQAEFTGNVMIAIAQTRSIMNAALGTVSKEGIAASQKKSQEALWQAVMLLAQAHVQDMTRGDYTDFLWFPTLLGKMPKQTDVVILDEIQDYTALEAEFAAKLGRRIIAAGDPHQSIHEFRGATDGYGVVVGYGEKVGLPTQEWEMHVSYRLPTAVTQAVNAKMKALVRKEQDVIVSADGNAVGSAQYVDEDQCWNILGPKPGDFLLTKTNVEAVQAALILCARGVAAYPTGLSDDEIGMRILEGLSRANPLLPAAELSKWLDSRPQEQAAGGGRDAIVRLAVKRLKEEGGAHEEHVQCMTVWKAKGLEADNVWLLDRDYPANVWYVGMTRARKNLMVVTRIAKSPAGYDKAYR